MRQVVLALVAGAGIALTSTGWVASAQAAPVGGLARPDVSSDVIVIRRGGRGGGGRVGRGGGFRGGGIRGGGRAFRGGGFRGGGRVFRGGRVHRGGRGFRRYRRGRIFIYGGPTYYAPYYYTSRCGWLRRRAIRTGSRYWWRRYRACLRGYY